MEMQASSRQNSDQTAGPSLETIVEAAFQIDVRTCIADDATISHALQRAGVGEGIAAEVLAAAQQARLSLLRLLQANTAQYLQNIGTIEHRSAVFYARQSNGTQDTEMMISSSRVVSMLGGLYRQQWEEAITPQLQAYRRDTAALHQKCVLAGIRAPLVPLLAGLEQLASNLEAQAQAA